MIRQGANGLVFYQFVELLQHATLQHAVFTRLGGRSQGAFAGLNVGHLVGDDPAIVQANHELIGAALDIAPDAMITARQVHGANVAIVHGAQRGTVVPATDALIGNEPGIALLLRFADCAPVLLYDPQRRAIGLAHAGWRGLVGGVVPNTVAALQSSFGCRPADLMVSVGPAIGPCCYEVQRPGKAGDAESEVVTAVTSAFGAQSGLLTRQPDGAVHLDLPAAVRRQLQQCGVQRIEDSGLCTACHCDEFFSHRAAGGNTGRFAVVLSLRAPKAG